MYEMRGMVAEERDYSYSQSHQISMQTGMIGYLRADMGSGGNAFYSTWNDFRKDLKTEEFKREFDDVINAQRAEGGFLSNRAALKKFCFRSLEMAFDEDMREFGVRIDTEKYAYLLRLNPRRGEYNLYCYCYQKRWLDNHLENARQGIRFIDSHYHEKFRIPNGEKIKVTRADGQSFEATCKYIDEYHLEVGNNLYHICEFMERMERGGSKVEPIGETISLTKEKRNHDRER